MYSLNYIPRNTLITSTECTAIFGNTVSPEKWNNAIEIAEARFVMPLLGYNLYTDICAAKNVVVTSGNISTLQPFFNAQYPAGTGTAVTLAVGNIVNAVELPTMSAAYQTLWNQYLRRYVYECVYFVALSANYAQFSSQGLLKSNPIGSALADSKTESVGVSLADVKWLEDRSLLDRINPLQTVLEEYLCANKGTYTLYSNSRCECLKSKRTTSFILDIYNDDDEYGHYNRDNNPIPPAPTPMPYNTTCSITAKIVAAPDINLLFPLCNLQTIQAEYPAGNTLTIPHMIGKYVTGIMTLNSNPVSIPFDSVTGTFDNTEAGGFLDGDKFIFLYTETM